MKKNLRGGSAGVVPADILYAGFKNLKVEDSGDIP